MTTRTSTFTVSLSQDHANVVSVSYATFDKTAVGGRDYTTATGTLTFNPGELTKTIPVTVQAVSDRDLTFGVAMTGIVNCTLSVSNIGVSMIKADKSLSSLVATYNANKALYTKAYATWSNASSAQSGAQTAYNNALSAYNSAQTNATNLYNSAVSAQSNTDAAHETYVYMVTYHNDQTGPCLIALNNWQSALATSNAAWNSSNIANSQRDSANATLSSATTTLNNANSALTTANTNKNNASTVMNSAKAAAAAGFVGSTALIA